MAGDSKETHAGSNEFIVAGKRDDEKLKASAKRQKARERAKRRRERATSQVSNQPVRAGVLVVDAGAFITGPSLLRGMGRVSRLSGSILPFRAQLAAA